MKIEDAVKDVEKTFGRPVKLVDSSHLHPKVVVIVTEDVYRWDNKVSVTRRVTVYHEDRQISQHVIGSDTMKG